MDKVYSVNDVADLLGVDPETVRRWIRQKKLIAQKTSDKSGHKILEKELQLFLDAMPKYKARSSDYLLGGILASTLIAASFGVNKINSHKNATFDRQALLNVIQTEMNSHKAILESKKKSRHQLDKEISEEERRIYDLKKLMDTIRKESED